MQEKLGVVTLGVTADERGCPCREIDQDGEPVSAKPVSKVASLSALVAQMEDSKEDK